MFAKFYGGERNNEICDVGDLFKEKCVNATCLATNGIDTLIGCPIVEGYQNPSIVRTEDNNKCLLYYAEQYQL